MGRVRRVAGTALVGMGVALLCVGMASTPPTVWRHIIQVIPIFAVAGMVGRRVRVWPFLAGAVCLFWLGNMVASLLGIADVISGPYPSLEVVLTIIIGLFAVAGLVCAGVSVELTGWAGGMVAFVVTVVVQYAAVWVSMQTMFRQG